MTYKERKEAARQLLIEYYQPRLSRPGLFWSEVAVMTDEIRVLASRYGLIEEAVENGLL